MSCQYCVDWKKAKEEEPCKNCCEIKPGASRPFFKNFRDAGTTRKEGTP